MKIVVSLFLCLVMALSFAGCKKKEKKAQVKENCSECGAKIVEGTVYCVWCGESLGIDDEK